MAIISLYLQIGLKDKQNGNKKAAYFLFYFTVNKRLRPV